jgi:hypothetical protein
MTNLLTRHISSTIIQRIRDLYRAVFVELWWIPLIFLLISLIRGYQGKGFSLEGVAGLIFIFALVSVILSHKQYVHKNFYEIRTMRQFIIATSWLVICIVIAGGLHLPFSFREMLPDRLLQMSVVARILFEACTLGVTANILVLWLYKFLEYHQAPELEELCIDLCRVIFTDACCGST